MSGEPIDTYEAVWAITSFFNPAGYRRRLLNYRQFHAALQVPLATIELSFDDRWELNGSDADILVRVTDGDVMWQKERLLNLLIKRLPPECKYVAWLDSDVLFQDPGWPRQATEILTSVPLTQLFTTLSHLDQDGNRSTNIPLMPSTAAAVHAGRPASVVLQTANDTLYGPTGRGMAWAARRDLLEQHGFYDSCVVGGGDTALLGAAYGVPEMLANKWSMHPAQRERYLRWAHAFHRDVGSNVGTLPGEIHHLWHGNLDDRHYLKRHIDLVGHGFDPTKDIRLGINGAWRWASHKPEMHALVKDYFHSRNEDGDAQEREDVTPSRPKSL